MREKDRERYSDTERETETDRQMEGEKLRGAKAEKGGMNIG